MFDDNHTLSEEIHIIGVLESDIHNGDEAPKNYTESKRRGTIKVYSQYQDGLDGIQPGQEIVVLFWLDRSDRSVLKVYPRGDRSKGLRGVFATRSPARPNPIAISELKVVSVKGNLLEVTGLDIFTGTPILDIKKKISR